MTEDSRRSSLDQAMALAPSLDPKCLAKATGVDEDEARLVRNAVLDALGMPSLGDIAKRYVLDVGRGEWATVYLSAAGRVTILSGWGNYSHYWSHHGYPSVAHFIAQRRGIGHDYLLSKFAPEKVIDPDRSVKSIRQAILEMRRRRGCDADEARAEWDLVAEFDAQDIDASEWHRRTTLDDAYEYLRHSYKHDAIRCLEVVWPALVEAVRSDLALDERGEAKEATR